MRLNWNGVALALLVSASPVVAQGKDAQGKDASGQKCSGAPVALPAELAAWPRRTAVTAATSATGLASAKIKPGEAANARLAPGKSVHFPDGPNRAAEVGDHAGMFAVSVAEAGTYRVALGSGGWVDILVGGKAVTSSAHGHGPDCSGVVKIVDFPLPKGDHVLQIEGSKEATVPVLIVRAP